MRIATIGLLATALLTGCGGGVRQVKLTIVPSKDMNDARSCYLLARAVDEKVYGVESYDDVATKAMAPDTSVTRSVVVLPGVKQEIVVPVPEKGRIAVYALLRQPEDDGWRLVFPETAPDRAEIRVGKAKMCWATDERSKGGMGACKQETVVRR